MNEYLDELDLRNLAIAIEVDVLEGLPNLFWGLVDVFHLRRPGIVPDLGGDPLPCVLVVFVLVFLTHSCA